MKRSKLLKFVFVGIGLFLLLGMLFMGCDGHRRRHYYWLFSSSLNTLLAEDGLAFSANGHSLYVEPGYGVRCFFNRDGDAIVLFVTRIQANRDTYYAPWASYYVRSQGFLTPPVEIRGEGADFKNLPGLPAVVVMFYRAEPKAGTDMEFDGVSGGSRTGDAVILYSQQDIDTDTGNTAGDEKGPNTRLYYARFMKANLWNKAEGYGFGSPQSANAKSIDGYDGDFEDVARIDIPLD